MRFALTTRAVAHYQELPEAIQRLVGKQLTLLCTQLTHPSLHAKKYDESRTIWQGRINRDYRFYFTILGDTYYILAIRKHPK